MVVRAFRGAAVIKEDTKEEIFDAVEQLITNIMSLNNLKAEDMTDIIFTVTPDITAAFPAAGVRKLGITDVPMLDMAAPAVEGALQMCIRVMVHANTDKGNGELNHVYLGGAAALRPDLAKDGGKISVAVDGPAGAGKSSVAKRVAKELGYVHIDTGAMYRAVGVFAIKEGIDIADDTKKLTDRLEDVKIDISFESDIQKVYLNGEDVSERIREKDAGMAASLVAKIPEVRHRLVALQRELAKRGGVIVDGRDIGTAVLPDADLKVYLTASVEARALRRFKEYEEKGISCDLEELKREICVRDRQDMTREVSPLKQADDAVLLDTTELDFDGAVKTLKDMIETAAKNK